jgi:hypothetical protein
MTAITQITAHAVNWRRTVGLFGKMSDLIAVPEVILMCQNCGYQFSPIRQRESAVAEGGVFTLMGLTPASLNDQDSATVTHHRTYRVDILVDAGADRGVGEVYRNQDPQLR